MNKQPFETPYVLCSSCQQLLPLTAFTKNQLKKKREPRCKSCVETEVLGKIKGQNKSWEVLQVPAGETAQWPQACFKPKTQVFQMPDGSSPQNSEQGNKIAVLVARGSSRQGVPQQAPSSKKDPTRAHQHPNRHVHTASHWPPHHMASHWPRNPQGAGAQNLGRNNKRAQRPPSQHFQKANFHESDAAQNPNHTKSQQNSPVQSFSQSSFNNASYQSHASNFGGPIADSNVKPSAHHASHSVIAGPGEGTAASQAFPRSVHNIGPMISESAPKAHQYASANAQRVPIGNSAVVKHQAPPVAPSANQSTSGEVEGELASETSVKQFLEWSDGSKYYGDLVNGERQGNGLFIWADGIRYTGSWKGNEMHGEGTLSLKDSRVYFGHFVNGKYHGEGILAWPDGAIYEGSWKHGRPHGYGSYECARGGKYIGDWRYGTQYGKGTCLYPNGIMYTGEFKNNLRHGRGTCQWPDGSYYCGLWDNNEMRNPQEKQKERVQGQPDAEVNTERFWNVIYPRRR